MLLRVRPFHAASVALSALLVAALVSPAAGHDGTPTHLWTQHIKPRLSQPGTLNASSNPVDWTKLKGVPAGFADGVDDAGDGGGGGDITSVTAGTGLTGGGASGDVGLAADYAQVQQRVTGTCTAGKAVVSINMPGTVTCGTATAAFSRHRKAQVVLGPSVASVGSISLDTGSYVILAKYMAAAADDLYGPFITYCELVSGGNVLDIARAEGDNGRQMVTMTAVHSVPITASGSATITLQCSDSNADGGISDLRITAIQVGSLTNTPIS